MNPSDHATQPSATQPPAAVQPPYAETGGLLRIFPCALLVVGLAWTAFEAAAARLHDRLGDLDQQVVVLLRGSDDSSRMIGPPVLEELMRDITGLGGYAVLVLVVFSYSILLRLMHGRRDVNFFLATAIGGFLCSAVMKRLVGRERPGIVPHLSYVETSSFPSTHAMMSLIIFLTIGLLLARHTRDHRVRALLVAVPLLLTFLVGISRVFMGVHFPTDVLAGWTAGLLWTWAAFSIHMPHWPRPA